MADAIARQQAMLRHVPRAPAKVTAGEVTQRLRDDGYDVSKRTVERDLQSLSDAFPLVLDESSKPYGWSWMKDAHFDFLPRLTISQAVALTLARAHLRTLLPQGMQKDLQPIFNAAERELSTTGWRDWHQRTAIVPTSLALLPPKLSNDVLGKVESAIAQRHCIEGSYRTKGSAKEQQWTIHPLGLLSRGPVIYLVCTLFDYTDVRMLALHRLTGVSELDQRRTEPHGFNLRDYAASDGSHFQSRGPIQLVARFDPAAVEHLRETPLSSDQSLMDVEDGARVELTASVDYDETLRWWLLGFGDLVEVVGPANLRSDVATTAERSLANYAQHCGVEAEAIAPSP